MSKLLQEAKLPKIINNELPPLSSEPIMDTPLQFSDSSMTNLSHLNTDFFAHLGALYPDKSQDQSATYPSAHLADDLQKLAADCAEQVISIRQEDKHPRRLHKI